MSVTYGFYNSLNGDRKYNAEQMSSIFDGIIKDGVMQQIGDKMVVTASSPAALTVVVGTGRAWFNQTWTLNDAKLVLTLPTPEKLLNRYDAVVLEVNSNSDVRANSIKIIEGTPASSPSKPKLTNNTKVHQHPLAYVYVKAGATAITQANITNCVGTSACPYVTAPLKSVSVDELFAQWTAEWDEWETSQQDELFNWATNQKNDFSKWRTTQQNDFSSWKTTQTNDFSSWKTTQTNDFTSWKTTQQNDFSSWKSTQQNDFSNWRATNQTAFNKWYAGLEDTLSGDVAANLAQLILGLQTDFGTLMKKHRIYDVITDSSSDTITDSYGTDVEGTVTFASLTDADTTLLTQQVHVLQNQVSSIRTDLGTAASLLTQV